MSVCPVCDSSFCVDITTYDGDVETEVEQICDKCGYSYKFSYGSYCVIVQGEMFEWCYRDQSYAAMEAIRVARAALHSV